MRVETLKLEGIHYIPEFFGEIIEAIFKDEDEEKHWCGREFKLYANLSTIDTGDLTGSELRVYPYSYLDLYSPDDYEMRLTPEIREYMKEKILDVYSKASSEIKETAHKNGAMYIPA